MQKNFYKHVKDPIYGAEKEHNEFEGYKHLFKGLNTKKWIALDFGCGLGRGIRLYNDRFKRIDGADINKEYINYCKNIIKNSTFYLTNGIGLNKVEDNTYDLIYSTTTLQHIPVYDIRFNILRDFYRVLKPHGWISIQMGFGEHLGAKEYKDNFWKAEGTNSRVDTKVNINELILDLNEIGFKNFKYWITNHGPSDRHSNWIFYRAQK